MEKSRSPKVGAWVGLSLLVIVILSAIVAVYFLAMAGAFELLGVQYESVWRLALFAGGFFLIGAVLDVLVNPLADILAGQVSGRAVSILVKIMLDTLSNWVSLFVMNVWVSSVLLSSQAMMLLAIVIALIEFGLEQTHSKQSP
ncbi:hypothetical protein ABID56_001364 [Alkalibacillus flavidus]|uniref:Regulatory protein YrvL n=1 Tax=Alkalibacillus flavidus TaxID=546021 RepID=A0ABV2KUM4_9BACI